MREKRGLSSGRVGGIVLRFCIQFAFTSCCYFCTVLFVSCVEKFLPKPPPKLSPKPQTAYFFGGLGVDRYDIVVRMVSTVTYFYFLSWMVFRQAEFKSDLVPIDFHRGKKVFCKLQIQNHLKTFLQSSCLQIVLITMLNSWLFGVQLKLKLWKKVFCKYQIQNQLKIFLQSSCLEIVLITMLKAWLFGVQLKLKLWILCAHKPT